MSKDGGSILRTARSMGLWFLGCQENPWVISAKRWLSWSSVDLGQNTLLTDLLRCAPEKKGTSAPNSGAQCQRCSAELAPNEHLLCWLGLLST